jgi:response regulator RpfG family c-di-GMP phosphodiesterase
MPEMSGTSLLQVVKATSPRTARIMLTGYAGDPEVLAGEENQLMEICAKPWNDEELKRTIRERLPDRR